MGLSGFVVNFAVYAFALHVLNVHYMGAATLAFCVAVANNFTVEPPLDVPLRGATPATPRSRPRASSRSPSPR